MHGNAAGMIDRRGFLQGALSVSAGVLLPGCSGARGGAITVGSKEFTEEILLGEMYAQLLENHGYNVRRRLGLGGTQVAMAALERGSIDLYPEYTGTAWLVILGAKHPPVGGDLYAAVSKAYRRFDLVWLAPAPMNDSEALAMTAAAAANITTLSELAGRASAFRLAAVPEFLDRADGLPGLRAKYGGFQFKSIQLFDSGLKYQALESGHADVVVAFSTDGKIVADRLRILRDDRGLWPEYHVAPVVRGALLRANPRIARVLDPLAPTLTTAAVQRLNAHIDVEKRDVADVAREHLQTSKLLARAA